MVIDLRERVKHDLLIMQNPSCSRVKRVTMSFVLENELNELEIKAREVPHTSIRKEMRWTDAILRQHTAPRADMCRLINYCMKTKVIVAKFRE